MLTEVTITGTHEATSRGDICRKDICRKDKSLSVHHEKILSRGQHFVAATCLMDSN